MPYMNRVQGAGTQIGDLQKLPEQAYIMFQPYTLCSYSGQQLLPSLSNAPSSRYQN